MRGPGRRGTRIAALLCLALGLGLTWTGSGTPLGAASAGQVPLADTTTATYVPPLVFGTAARTKANLQAQEKVAGRPLVAVRVYRRWGEPLFDADTSWMRDTYHTLFLSVKTMRANGTPVLWSDIAAATPGSPLYVEMQQMASQLKAFGARVFFTLDHEPEASDSDKMGTGPQYVLAFRKFESVMHAEQVGNVVWMAVYTDFGFYRTDAHNMRNYYPGDAYVSMVGVDAYNWGLCKPGTQWASLASRIDAARQWGLQHPSVLMMVTEWGSNEDPANPTRKASWLHDAEQLFKQPAYHQFAGVITYGGLDPTDKCAWDFTSSPATQAAWVTWARDPAYSAWE